MFSGPPLPLPHGFPMRQLLTLIQAREDVGVWLRGCGRELRLRTNAAGRYSSVLISGDLGLLLRCCSQVAVREGSHPVVLGAEVLIGWRALQVVTGMPYLPRLERLKEIFPGARLNPAGFHVPIERRPPEDVLADCLTRAIRVLGSRIVYCAPSTPPPVAALDRAPPTSRA